MQINPERYAEPEDHSEFLDGPKPNWYDDGDPDPISLVEDKCDSGLIGLVQKVCGLEASLRQASKTNWPGGYRTKDSGKREEYSSGMVRDTQSGKPRYDLIDLAFLRRWADLMGRGADKYGERNWELASSESELRRFRQSALRHMFQWLEGDTEEDHAAAVAFNLAAAEYVKGKLDV